VPKKKDAGRMFRRSRRRRRAEGRSRIRRGWPSTSIRIEVPEVTVDVGVLLEKTHQFVPGLKPSNFKCL
jgi:hypothetical protein